MRNLLALLAAALLSFAGIGWYLDWYKVQSTTTKDGHRRVNIDIHSQKIGDDLQKGSEKLQEAWERQRSSGDPASKDFVGPRKPGMDG